MNKEQQAQMQNYRLEIINRIESVSEAAKKISNKNVKEEEKAIILNQMYDKETQRLTKESKALDSQTRQRVTGQGVWLKPPAKEHSSKNEIKVFQDR